MSEITVDKAWLEKQFTRTIAAGMVGGMVIGAVVMFLVCHFRWELL
jgi:hypothetical protein